MSLWKENMITCCHWSSLLAYWHEKKMMSFGSWVVCTTHYLYGALVIWNDVNAYKCRKLQTELYHWWKYIHGLDSLHVWHFQNICEYLSIIFGFPHWHNEQLIDLIHEKLLELDWVVVYQIQIIHIWTTVSYEFEDH